MTIDLAAGEYSASIRATGARLLTLDRESVPIVVPAPHGSSADTAYWGSVLAPWPNRLRDGRFEFRGTEYLFPLNDAATSTALHGFFADAPFTIDERSDEHVVLSSTSAGSPAWPSLLRLTVSYALGDGGMSSSLTLTNIGEHPCPAGLGVHPYFDSGGSVDGCSVALPTRAKVVADDRLLPVDLEPAPKWPQLLDGVVLDDTYGGVVSDSAGRSHTLLERADGRTTHIWAGDTARWWQVFTADTLPEPLLRSAVAIEPMTCPPDALTTGDIDILAPGDWLTLAWGVSLTNPPNS